MLMGKLNKPGKLGIIFIADQKIKPASFNTILQSQSFDKAPS